MRPRIQTQSVDQRIWNNKRALAEIIARENNCTLGKALSRVEFNLAYNRI